MLGELTNEEETNLLLNQLFSPDLAVQGPAAPASSDFMSQPWFWPAVAVGGYFLFTQFFGKGKSRRRRR